MFTAIIDFPVSAPPELTMEQYLAFVGGKTLAQIVSPLAVTPPPAAKPVPQPARPPGSSRQQKDSLAVPFTPQKDTCPGMILSLSR